MKMRHFCYTEKLQLKLESMRPDAKLLTLLDMIIRILSAKNYDF